MKILLIEDNADHVALIRDMYNAQFDGEGSLVEARTLGDGLQMLDEQDFDVCICDLSLPDSPILNTIEVIQSSNTDIPIVVLTSLDDLEMERQLIQHGIQDYLPKMELSPTLLYRTCIHAVERKRLNQKIQSLSVRDPLTELYNRREFDRQLAQQISLCQRHDTIFSLCVIDVDDFKSVNDNYGHQAGDAALRHLSETLVSCIRDTDVACRIGGDEFTLLLLQTSAADSMHCARRIQDRLNSETFEYEGQQLSLSVSIGIAEYKPPMKAEELYALADKALYESKEAGRDCIHIEPSLVGVQR